MCFRHNAFEPPARQRLKGKHRVIQHGAQRHQFAFAKQQVIDGVFDFQDIDLDQKPPLRLNSLTATEASAS
jgi:hypothetical protein